jgi:Phosphotransferase enzyme family
MVPDFLILARKGGAVESAAPDGVPGAIAAALRDHAGGESGPVVMDSLSTHPFRNKQTIRVHGDGATRAIAKLANLRRLGADDVEKGFKNLSLAWCALSASESAMQRSVPEPLALVQVGDTLVAVEAAVSGVSLEDLAMEPGYMHEPDRVRHHIDLIVEWIVRFQSCAARHLAETVRAEVPAHWLAGTGRDGSTPSASIQHGDLFPGNIVVNERNRRIAVIDWDELARGYPPMFDFFCAVTGLAGPSGHRAASHGHPWEAASLAYTFVENNWFSDHVRTRSRDVCAAFEVGEADLSRYFLQYLVVRAHQIGRQPSCAGIAHIFERMHREIHEGSARSIFAG